MGSQWNSVTDLDWSTPVDPEALVATTVRPWCSSGPRRPSPARHRPLGGREFTALGVELFTASLSQFMHGEQGAMLTAAKIVETVP